MAHFNSNNYCYLWRICSMGIVIIDGCYCSICRAWAVPNANWTGKVWPISDRLLCVFDAHLTLVYYSACNQIRSAWTCLWMATLSPKSVRHRRQRCIAFFHRSVGFLKESRIHPYTLCFISRDCIGIRSEYGHFALQEKTFFRRRMSKKNERECA